MGKGTDMSILGRLVRKIQMLAFKVSPVQPSNESTARRRASGSQLLTEFNALTKQSADSNRKHTGTWAEDRLVNLD